VELVEEQREKQHAKTENILGGRLHIIADLEAWFAAEVRFHALLCTIVGTIAVRLDLQDYPDPWSDHFQLTRS
jgi:hypothetical protein